MAKKKSKKSIIRKPIFMAFIGLAIVAVLVVAFILVRNYLPKEAQGDVVATVNGESIDYSEIKQIKDLIAKSPLAIISIPMIAPAPSFILAHSLTNKPIM